jgi:hypothetical protein
MISQKGLALLHNGFLLHRSQRQTCEYEAAGLTLELFRLPIFVLALELYLVVDT